jgi:hypothetical protein
MLNSDTSLATLACFVGLNPFGINLAFSMVQFSHIAYETALCIYIGLFLWHSS